MESINVIMDDKEEWANAIEDVGTFLETSTDIPVKTEEVQDTPPELEVDASNKVPSIRIQKDHPKDLIIGDLNSGVITSSKENILNSCFVIVFWNLKQEWYTNLFDSSLILY